MDEEKLQDLDNSLLEVQDTDDTEQIKKQIESVEREIATFKRALDSKKNGLKDYETQAKLHEEVRQIQRDHFRKLEPAWKFETVERYWELQDELIKYKHRQEEQVDKGTKERFKAEIEDIKSNISFNKEKLKRLQALLGDTDE